MSGYKLLPTDADNEGLVNRQCQLVDFSLESASSDWHLYLKRRVYL